MQCPFVQTIFFNVVLKFFQKKRSVLSPNSKVFVVEQKQTHPHHKHYVSLSTNLHRRAHFWPRKRESTEGLVAVGVWYGGGGPVYAAAPTAWGGWSADTALATGVSRQSREASAGTLAAEEDEEVSKL